ncbi:ribosome biogenesis GTP-binding protein YihA/YsxC [Parvibium lacunae]|uniref:Probable GTP-binding protein EngB n=1 Tax=Parvibium lacunae TaxID=1888893 RepID=A0A368L002_9BURK|nr:ribosome biogenesis GTP-binding protein YihA/YsxC [Parvibium lacunae]RCS56601.1 YihA family ribosome biogenesis GTP-binding protein [Parvibium lacunae]
MSTLHQAKFFTTVNDLHSLPAYGMPEVAFVGRSNAGKSTAINILCNQKRLAFASKTPGRTQHINFFSLTSKETLHGYLVDLPGYGYAEVAQTSKHHWQQLLADYLVNRPTLKGVILLCDARRPFTELDQQLMDWLAPTGIPIHTLLTKADKLTRSEAAQVLQAGRAFLKGRQESAAPEGAAPYTIQLFSSLKRVGLEEAEAQILTWLNLPIPVGATIKKSPT